MIQVLDRIEQDDFYLPTYVASGHNVVEAVLKDSEEIKSLTSSGQNLNPIIEERARAIIGKPLRQQMPLIAYAIILKLNMDPNAVPILAEYLRSIPDDQASSVMSPWHPLKYVVDALSSITGGQVEVAEDSAIFDARQTLADMADRWYSSNISQQSGERRCPSCNQIVHAGKKFCTRDGTPVP